MSTSSTGSGIIEAAAKTSGRTTTINSPSPLSSATTTSGTVGNIKHHLEKDKKRKKSNLIRLSTSSTTKSTPNKSSQSMDLAPRGPSVVQLRPVRPVFSTLSTSLSSSTNKPNNTSSSSTSSPGGLISTTGGGGSPIISVNRTTPAGANVTILPARGVTTTVGNTQQGGIMPTYQITRVGVGNVVRPGGGGVVGPGQQPASITVTPLPTSNLTNLRLAAGTPVNNGTWLQASGVQGFARAIAVGGRPVRPADSKMIHIPQHVTQLQVVDGKGSILKPQIGTPIVNIRGPLPGGATSGQSLTLPLPPFTIRTTNITNISAAIQPRPPPTSSSSSGTPTSAPVHKVITQHDHNAPIQFVNATNKNAIGASIPKLSTVCLTLSTNATLAPNNSSPVVAVSSRAAGLTPSLIVTPSSLTANNTTTTTTTTLPITKVYPVGRDGSSVVMDNMFSSGSAVSVSTVNVNLSTISTNASNASNPSCVVVAASSSVGAHHHPQHVLLHTTTPTINVHTGQNPSSGGGIPPSNLGGIAPSYYVDKNFQMNILPHQSRPITLEKKIDPKSLPPGSMIITAAATTTTGNTVTIPLTQHLTNLAHLGHHQHAAGNTHNNIVNPNNSSTTIIATSTTSATSSSSTPPSSHNHLPHQILAQFNPHSVTVTPSSTSIPIPIPAHVISQSILGVTTTSGNSLGSVLTVTTTTISSTSGTSSSSTGSSSISSIISSSSSTPNTTSTTSILPSTMTSSSTSSTFTSSSTATTTTTAPPAQSPNHNNPPTSSTSNNNNNNTKATHSPRPSILRKRELGGDHHSHTSASRAQRNLSLQLNFSTSNSTNFTSSSNKENSSLLDKFSSGLSTSTSITSSVGGGATTGTGVSILKKEFQPPTEESSWQSVSSNSSSGSSTISTTSETAELQLQQQLTGGIGGGADLNLSTMSLPNSSEISASAFLGLGSSLLTNSILGGGGGKNSSSTTTTSTTTSTIGGLTAGGLTISLANIGGVGGGNSSTTIPTSSSSSSSQNQNQNGVLRTTNQPRSRSSSTSVGAKGANKDVERLKNKDKDLDACSPRKKPRKQQLTSSDLLEAASPEIYYQGKGKRFRKGDLMDFTEGITEKEKVPVDPIPEEPPPPRIVYYVKRPHMSLVQSNCIPPKPLTTHFQRYCDVKARDEKRPTISELANQKNILEKVGGWRVKLMTNQMQELVDNENGVVDDCSNLLNRLENKVGVGPSRGDRDLNIVMELLKGNIQRCKVIRDQMSDSKALAVKILDHKVTVTEVITKHSCKRPLAKKRVL